MTQTGGSTGTNQYAQRGKVKVSPTAGAAPG